MKSLIWKEVRQQLGWFLVAVSVSTWVWFRAANVWDNLVRGQDEIWILAFPLVYAFALAQMQFGRDGDTRHFGLLVHRGQGVRGYFAAKVIVGVTALLGLIVLPMTIWAVTMRLSDPDASLIRWTRIPEYSLYCVPVLIVYAVGVLSTQLRRGAFVRWGCAACGMFGSFLVAWPLSSMSLPTWVGLEVLLAAGVLWLARSLLFGGRDRDLPLRSGQLAGIALVALLTLVPFASFLRGTAEASALSTIVDSKPAVLFDPRSDGLRLAVRTEDGWIERGTENRFTKDWTGHFEDERDHDMKLVHYAGSPIVEGLDSAREVRAELAMRRKIADIAPSGSRNSDPLTVAVRADREPASEPDERWLVQFELDADDGQMHIDISRRMDGLPPFQWAVARPAGRFSEKACILESPLHSPLVLDCADGTLWRIRLEGDGARVDPLEIPGGDRVVSLEPLFQSDDALLGRYQQRYFQSKEHSSGYLFVGSMGKYSLLDGRIAPYGGDSRPENAVTGDEAAALARYSVASGWPDAFTEEVRVEQLPGHEMMFELRTGLSTQKARVAAAIYMALEFLRSPKSIVAERFAGDTASAGLRFMPFPKEWRLFANGRFPVLFSLLMLWGAAQLILGWRWLARGGVGIPTRILYMFFIFVGGVVALVVTRLLLPRRVRASTRAEQETQHAPLPARA